MYDREDYIRRSTVQNIQIELARSIPNQAASRNFWAPHDCGYLRNLIYSGIGVALFDPLLLH